MKPVVRLARPEDCLSLAPRLRAEDAVELELATGKTPLEALKESLEVSAEAFAAEADGVVVALWGCSFQNGAGSPWMVGSPEVLNYPVTFVAIGRVAVDRWSRSCSVLHNLTHTENTVHHRWLRHIGFSFAPDVVPCGPAEAPFLHFYRHSQ